MCADWYFDVLEFAPVLDAGSKAKSHSRSLFAICP